MEAVLSILSPLIEDDVNGTTDGTTRRKKKSTKGWDGEAVVVAGESPKMGDEQDGALFPTNIGTLPEN